MPPNSYAANSNLSSRELEDVVSKTDVELRTHFRELPSHLRLPASPKVPMLPHVCLFQYVSRRGYFVLKPIVDKANW